MKRVYLTVEEGFEIIRRGGVREEGDAMLPVISDEILLSLPLLTK